VASFHEQGRRVGAGSQLGGDQLQLGPTMGEGGDDRRRLDRGGDSGQRQQFPTGSVCLVAGASDDRGGGGQLRSWRRTGGGQRRAAPRVLPGTIELDSEANQAVFRGGTNWSDMRAFLDPSQPPLKKS